MPDQSAAWRKRVAAWLRGERSRLGRSPRFERDCNRPFCDSYHIAPKSVLAHSSEGRQVRGRGDDHREVESRGPNDARWNGFSLASSAFGLAASGRWKRNNTAPIWLGDLRWYKGDIEPLESIHYRRFEE